MAETLRYGKYLSSLTFLLTAAGREVILIVVIDRQQRGTLRIPGRAEYRVTTHPSSVRKP